MRITEAQGFLGLAAIALLAAIGVFASVFYLIKHFMGG